VIRLLIANLKAGVGKTTTAINLCRYLADANQRVLLIDTDPKGYVETVLGIRPTRHLAHFVAHRYVFSECVVNVADRFDVLCSNRETIQAEAALMSSQAREVILKHLLKPVEANYDAIILDSAPALSILQSCAMYYAGNVLIPVDMDLLSVSGAGATMAAVNQLNEFLGTQVQVAGFLPTIVDRRFQMAQTVLQALAAFQPRYGIPVLPEIRVDSAVPKSLRARKMLADFDPDSRAMHDYEVAFDRLLKALAQDSKSADRPMQSAAHSS
jgi:chromosome partitioning protein